MVEGFSDRGGHAHKKPQQWSLNHAREVFQEAEIYDEVFDCIMVTKAKQKEDMVCNPIYKMTEQDIWRYIHENEIEVNPLYRMGYKRVGCIGCPFGGRKHILKEFDDYPKYKLNYIRAFDRMLKARKESGKDDVTGKEGYYAWHTGEDVFEWWIQNYAYIPKGQMNLFEEES